VLVTIHPAYVLRLVGPDQVEQDAAFEKLVCDLRAATRFLSGLGAA